MSEFRIGGLLFTSKFDSGNLAHVEKAGSGGSNNPPSAAEVPAGGDQESGGTGGANRTSGANTSGSNSTVTGISATANNAVVGGDNQQQQQNSSPVRNGGAATQQPSGGSFSTAVPDLEVNCWTKKDAAGTPFENGNRTWFYFAVKGAPAGKYVKMNILNLNRQFRLFQQGMSPVYRVLPHKPQWERIREKPSYMNVGETDFMISFCHRFEHKNATVEFAFCYPFSYTEYQKWMEALDHEFHHCTRQDPLLTRQSDPDGIYYHRELAIRSFDNNRVDLLTISSYHGISEEREHRMDPHLFPDKHPRPFRFRHKRVFFLSSRVHPGETPSSFVFNGFLKFILRKDDPRSVALRRAFVFKLMPMLNPDGVIRGHYRTDSRGVNLNRVYLEPDVTLHPPIYAARQILFYHHLFNAVTSSMTSSDINNINGGSRAANSSAGANSNFGGSDKENSNNFNFTDISSPGGTVIGGGSNGNKHITRAELTTCSESDGVAVAANSQSACTNRQQPAGSGDESVSCCCPCLGVQGKASDCTKVDPDLSKLNDLPFLSSIHHKDSGVAFYVDLHGHASKRGCFMYGNHVENFTDHVENLLYPKIISLNTAHFDFGGCNFTEKNMYMKDKRDGASKEGAGRVAMFKLLGLIHSYTLECNYNTGRQTNCVAPACADDGRATPPPPAGFPPRYAPTHYEDVGKAVAIAALDMMLLNPWSRVSMSEFLNVQSCRAWVHKFVQGIYNGPGVPRKTNIKVPGSGPKPMAQKSLSARMERSLTYLHHLDKDKDDSAGGGVSRNRFPLRNSRAHLMATSSSTPPVNESSGGPNSGGAMNNSSGGTAGGGGFNSSGNSSGNSNNNNNNKSGVNNAPRSLGPIRENKAFQMRRQRLLQIHRPALAQQASQSNSTSNNNGTNTPSSLATNHSQSFSSVNNKQQSVNSSDNNHNSGAPTPLHFGSIPAYPPLNIGSDTLSISSSAMGGNCYQPLKHILHQANPSPHHSQSPHHPKHITGGGGGVGNTSSSSPSPAPPAAQVLTSSSRAVYNLPVTSSSLPLHMSGMSTAAALTYLTAHTNAAAAANRSSLPPHQHDPLSNDPLSKQGSSGHSSSSNIAGLAIISPRKNACSMLQKGGAPIVLANQMALSRTKLGINRSLSLLQQTAAGGPFLYSSAGASSTTNPNNPEGPGFYSAYERASQSSMAFKHSNRPTSSAKNKNAAPRLPIDASSANEIWASAEARTADKSASSIAKDSAKKAGEKVERACYSSGDDEMYNSIATYVTSSKRAAVESSVDTAEQPLIISDVTTHERAKSSSANGNKRAPSAGSNMKTPDSENISSNKSSKSKKHKNKKSQSQSNVSKAAANHNSSSSAGLGVRGESRGSTTGTGGGERGGGAPAKSKSRHQSAGGDGNSSSTLGAAPSTVSGGADDSLLNYRKFSIKSASSSSTSGTGAKKRKSHAKKSTTPKANATTA